MMSIFSDTTVIDQTQLDIGETITSGLADLWNSIIGAISTPFNVIKTALGGWADQIASMGWYSPIVLTAVGIICIIILGAGLYIRDTMFG